MPRLVAASALFVLLPLAGSAGAQPDRTEALAKAKTKFEQEISRAEDALLANIDKALAGKSVGKAGAEKLTYEREQFVNKRILPTAVPTTSYLRQRTQAVTALEAVYKPAIKELLKAQKDDEVRALENALSGLLRSARGYGLAFPELSGRPALLIENKAAGLVLEPEGKNATGDLTLAAKVGKLKPAQCWYFDREERGYSIHNGKSGSAIYTHTRVEDTTPFTVFGTLKLNAQKEPPPSAVFQVIEGRHEIALASTVKGDTNGFVLTALEKKQKGVTVFELTLTKIESPPSAGQTWIVSEAK